MRRIAEQDLDAWLAAGRAVRRRTTRSATWRWSHTHPEWIVRAFAEALGGDLAETARLLARRQRARPRCTCAPGPGRVDAAELADEVGGAPGAFSPVRGLPAGGAPGDLAAIRDGRAHVQDEGSQLVAIALVDAPLEGRDERWLDLCAGPGGKAGLLGAIAAQRGAQLTAVEVAEHRARLVANAVRGLPVTVLATDGRDVGPDPDLPEGGFDRVLVDAPCTGLGSLRRRPESRWRRQPSDLPPLTRLQRELLAAALRAVRPVGVVAYVTCSPHMVETQVTVTEALKRGPTGCRVRRRPAVAAGRHARSGRRPDRAAVAAPARHRRDVPGPVKENDRDHRAEHPGRRLRPPGRRGAGGRGRRRLAARRRHGQPLRAEPDDRPAGGGEPARGDRASRSTAT